MRAEPGAEPERPRLTLGALHRSLLELLDPGPRLRVEIRFDERTSFGADVTEPGREPELTEARSFQATIGLVDGVMRSADLAAGGPPDQSGASIRIRSQGDRWFYSTGDAPGYGVLTSRPELFDPAGFQRRLDSVSVQDAVIDRDAPGGAGRVLLDSEIDFDDFAVLRRAFAAEDADDDLEVRAYSVALCAAGDVTLDYWWSLLGRGAHSDTGRRETASCHVQVGIGRLENTSGEKIKPDPNLPVLADMDAVWQLARGHGGAAAKPA